MDAWMDELRAHEFGRLDANGQVYLDYTGGGLYAESLVRAHAEALTRGLFGNPHSQNPASTASTRRIEAARERVRRFFDADADEYEVVFSLNASGALKLVGEAYPFEPGSRYALTADNHNSVNGIREFARAKGAAIHYTPLNRELRVENLDALLAGADRSKPNLFAYPAQSNFSGVKHPLEWIERARGLGYDVLLDAAAFVPTNRLSLRQARPDFACVSFYKMFGYPTGVGALLLRREAMHRLHRPWFAGGTVRFVSAQNKVHLLYPSGEAFEDGTLNYLSIAAVPAGLDFLDSVGMERIRSHVAGLTGGLLRELGDLRHGNGAPLVQLYGPRTAEGRGGTIAFNLLDPDGRLVDFKFVEARAGEAGISLRTGCFCNPGAAEFAFEYAPAEAYRCYRTLSPESFSLQEFSVCMNNKPVGAVRASVGVATNAADLRRFLDFLRDFRDLPAPPLLGRYEPERAGG